MAGGLSWKQTILWISIYSIAMGFLESAVVIYLRNFYYPYGFDFPLNPIRNTDATVEIIREAATIIMILAVSIIAAKSFKQFTAYFLFIFAVWDIAYYVFLYLTIGWPQSILTWDILFLIPVTWTGPVITPVVVACTMILIALIILISDGIGEHLNFNYLTWSLFITGSLIIMMAFMWDHARFLLERSANEELWNLPGKTLFHTFEYVPRKFNWFLFITGEIIVILGIVNLAFRGNRNTAS